MTKTILASTIAISTLTPVTAFAQAQEQNTQVVTEVGENGKPFSVKGNGDVIDDISNDSSKQFITVKTKDNQTYFMVIDRAQSTENVYMMSLVDADDLSEFSKGASSTTQPVTETNEKTDTQDDTEEKGNSHILLFVVIGIIGLVAAGGYYFKVYKPKKEANAEKEEGIEGDVFDDNDEVEEYEVEEYEDEETEEDDYEDGLYEEGDYDDEEASETEDYYDDGYEDYSGKDYYEDPDAETQDVSEDEYASSEDDDELEEEQDYVEYEEPEEISEYDDDNSRSSYPAKKKKRNHNRSKKHTR